MINIFGNLFTDIMQSDAFRRAANGGLRDAAKIAERVRVETGVGRGDIGGEPASNYLANVLTRLQQHAETEAAKGYGRYRWLWYLRRLPDDVFDGDLATTGPYDRSLTEILATRGAGPAHALGSPAADGTFTIDDTVIKRVGWLCGFATAVSQFQVEARVVGKGSVLGFDRLFPGLIFPICRARRGPALDHQIREYDRRSEYQRLFTSLGIPIDDRELSTERLKPALFLLAKVIQGPPNAILPVSVEGSSFSANFHPTLLPLGELESLLSHESILGTVPWSGEIPVLVSLLYVTLIAFGRSLLSRQNLYKTGYMIIRREEFDDIHNYLRGEPTELTSLLRVFPELSTDLPLSERVMQMEGEPFPRLAGPVAFHVKDDLVGIDVYNATLRLVQLLTFPSVHGEAANVRAFAFERKVQETIDGTAWAPSDSIRKLIGHHFERNGKRIGEIDAFGALDGHSCWCPARA